MIPNLRHLKSLLLQRLSADSARQIVGVCANFYRDPALEERWFFLLMNQTLQHLLDDAGPLDADEVGPVFDALRHASLDGLSAVEARDHASLIRAANSLADEFKRFADISR